MGRANNYLGSLCWSCGFSTAATSSAGPRFSSAGTPSTASRTARRTTGSAISRRRHRLPTNRSLVPSVLLPVIRVQNRGLPKPRCLIQRPACVGLRRIEHIVLAVIGVANASIIAAQGDPAVRLSIWPVVDIPASVIAGLYPFAGGRVYERVEELFLSDDDLKNFTVEAFCIVRHDAPLSRKRAG